MISFVEILEARANTPELVHGLAVSRLLETLGDRSLTIVGDTASAWEELKVRGYLPALGLLAFFEARDGTGGEEGLTCTDRPPWSWIEAAMEDAWRREQGK
jgi:hypothetical protein